VRDHPSPRRHLVLRRPALSCFVLLQPRPLSAKESLDPLPFCFWLRPRHPAHDARTAATSALLPSPKQASTPYFCRCASCCVLSSPGQSLRHPIHALSLSRPSALLPSCCPVSTPAACSLFSGSISLPHHLDASLLSSSHIVASFSSYSGQDPGISRS
jgi:hypothetical protein